MRQINRPHDVSQLILFTIGLHLIRKKYETFHFGQLSRNNPSEIMSAIVTSLIEMRHTMGTVATYLHFINN